MDGGSDACWEEVYCGILLPAARILNAAALELLGVVIMGWGAVCVLLRRREKPDAAKHRDRRVDGDGDRGRRDVAERKQINQGRELGTSYGTERQIETCETDGRQVRARPVNR